ncbi:FkbM family methyltransferase [Desulfobulbus sp. TB]|nr:FkbM family methyltransferase [Desulfobulbus sp. TB]
MKILPFFEKIQKTYLKKKEKCKSASVDEVIKAEKLFYSEYITRDMTVFDVGANVGDLTMLFSCLVGPNGRVHAFEPTAATYDRLKKVINSKELENVTMNHCALSDKIGVANIHVYDDDHSTLNSLANRPLKKYGVNVTFSSIEETCTNTIDAYCQERSIEHIDLLKIDVEGAELQVLQGTQAMMQEKRITCCVFEFGQTIFDMGITPREIKDFFNKNDYQICNLVEGDPIFPGGEDVSTARFSMHIAKPNR